MTLPADDETRLAELRHQWQQHPDRRAQIEAEAAEIRALALLRDQFGAEVIGEQPTIERTTTP